MEKIKDFISLMRPKQWFKSFYIVLGTVPAILLNPVRLDTLVILLLAGIFNMILIQGVMYVTNDVADVEKDRMHPKKRKRPIASRKISVSEAVAFGLILFLSAVALAAFLDFRIILIDVALFLNNILYSFRPTRLRDVAYIDVGSVALNFPLRVMVGWFLFEPYNHLRLDLLVPMILLTYFFAVFLLSLKRIAEKRNLKNAKKFRKSLERYTVGKLKAIAIFSSIIVSISFVFFAWNLKPVLVILYPYVFFMMYWYSRLAFSKNSVAMAPEEIFLKMPKFTLAMIVLCLSVLLILLL